MACMGARGCLACSHALPAAGPCGERCLLGQCQNLPTSWSEMWMDGVGSCTQPFSVVADTRGRRQCWWLQASRCRRPPGCGETRMVGVPRAVGGGWLPLHEAATGWPRSRTAALACVDDAEALMTASHGTKRDLLEGPDLAAISGDVEHRRDAVEREPDEWENFPVRVTSNLPSPLDS